MRSANERSAAASNRCSVFVIMPLAVAADRDVPRDQQSLSQGDQAEQAEAQHGQQEYPGECQVRAHVARGDLDIEAEALVAADELRDGRAHRGVERGVLESDEALRQ